MGLALPKKRFQKVTLLMVTCKLWCFLGLFCSFGRGRYPTPSSSFLSIVRAQFMQQIRFKDLYCPLCSENHPECALPHPPQFEAQGSTFVFA